MNSFPKNFYHIIWDWNGTLFNDVELCASIMNILLTQESLPNISIQRYKEIFTFPVIDYYKIAGHTFEKNSFEELGKQFMVEYELRKSFSTLFPGVIDLLSELKRNNIQQHLLSAYEQQSLNNILKYYQIDSFFQNIVGLDNIYANGKTHLAHDLIKKINSNGGLNKVLLIGDTIHDYEIAKEIGASCILMTYGHQDRIRLSEIGVPLVNDFEQLGVLLKENLY